MLREDEESDYEMIEEELYSEEDKYAENDEDDDEKALSVAPFSFKKAKLEQATNEKQDNILELSKYKADNENLLFLYSYALELKTPPAQHCPSCGAKFNFKEEELFQTFKYEYQDKVERVYDIDKHPKAYHQFRKKNKLKPKDKASIVLFWRRGCCQDQLTTIVYCGVLDRTPKMKQLKCWYSNERECVDFYLDISPESLAGIPAAADYRLANYLKGEYLSGAYRVPTNGFCDTSDFVEAAIPTGFKYKLRDYQLRSISWMKSIEAIESTESNTLIHNYCKKDIVNYLKLKLGHSPLYFGLADDQPGSKITESSETQVPDEPLRLYGGILADDTGSGKTITTLGLIHAAPLTAAGEQERIHRFKSALDLSIPSRATCIICPSNIHKQWLQEAKKCNPRFKVIGLFTMSDHGKVSWRDAMVADVIVVSYQFLLNTNYSKLPCYSAFTEHDAHLDEKGRFDLHVMHFYRIILDEIHELDTAKARLVENIKILSADFKWGLSGTFKQANLLSTAESFLAASTRLLTVCAHNINAREESGAKYVKRNVPNLELPPIVNETVWVQMTAQEWALFRWKGLKTQIREQIMMCSHYQLSDKASVEVDSFVSLGEAKRIMSAVKKKELDVLENRDAYYESELAKEDLSDSHRSTLLRGRAEMRKELDSARGNYNYFQNVFRAIEDPTCNDCSICHETIAKESLSILPCSHIYCYECIEPALQRASKCCPLCNRKVQSTSDIYRIRVVDDDADNKGLASLETKEIDTSRYSVKMISVYRYITGLLSDSGEGSKARIILFLQYGDLANFMSESLKELGIKHVRVVGNVFQRQNAITQFRESQDVRLIMLSSENSVSGINLTQATHIILMHPFWSDKGEYVDLAYEKQGISRAYRFGLQHPLKIVRFAVKGTIEEEITIRRQNVQL